MASCNRSYSRWVNVSQTSPGWTDIRRNGVHAEIQPLLQQRGKPGLECLWEKQSQHGTKATMSYANRVVSWRGGSQDHYPRGWNILFWHVEHLPQNGTREATVKLGVIKHLHTITWVYTQSRPKRTQDSSVYHLLVLFTLWPYGGSVWHKQSKFKSTFRCGHEGYKHWRAASAWLRIVIISQPKKPKKLSVVSLPPWFAQKTSRRQDSYQPFTSRNEILRDYVIRELVGVW